MKNTRKYTDLLKEILLPKGFFKYKQGFLRLHGDGVLQGVFFHYEPHAKYIPEWGDGHCMFIAIHSIYEKDVFEPLGLSKGQLTRSKMVGELCGFQEGLKPKKSLTCTHPKTEFEQLDLLQSNVIDVLDAVNNQDLLYQLLVWSDVTRCGELSLVDSSKIAPLAHLRRYDEAIQVCSTIIDQNLHALADNETWMSQEQVSFKRKEMDIRLFPIFQIRDYMMANDHEAASKWLQMNQKQNLLIWEKINTKSRIPNSTTAC